jgi:pyruvate dehydrogenase E2 component (dihydrolipoamide acetyltransferase)
MATQVIMPKQGLQMTEGLITHWLVRENEPVKEGTPLFEMETDKLTIEIMAPATGTLLKILRQEGDVVPVAEVIALIGQPGEAIGEPAVLVQEQQPQPEHKERIFTSPRARMRAEEKEVDLQSIAGSGPEGLIIERDVLQAAAALAPKVTRATPLAARIAGQAGIPIDTVSGTGPRGKVMRADVEAAADAGSAAPASAIQAEQAGQPEAAEPGKLIPFSGIRKIIANRMLQSVQEMAQANHRMNVDMSEIIRLREQLKAVDRPVSFTDLVVKVVAVSLREFSMLNATVTPQGILLQDNVHIGVAVAIPAGLVVPVIRHADRLSVHQIATKSAELIEKARTGKLVPDDYSGGTFTVTNLGMYDIDSFTAIINPPECAILAIGKIEKTPVVRDDTVMIRPIMTMSLTYDHRVVDGALAAQFLQRIKQILQNPWLLI